MKNQKKFQKLVKSILIDFIICGIMSTVLSAVSALIKNYYTPFADIIDYIDIITVILIFGVFITKVIAHIRKFIENK